MELYHVSVGRLFTLSPNCSFAELYLYRRSQTDFTLRCMFPRYSDWNVSYTRSGSFKRDFRQVVRYAVLFIGAFCATYAIGSGASLVGLAKGVLLNILIFLEYGSTYCRQRLGQSLGD